LLNEAHRLYAGQEGSLVLPVKQQELAGLIGASRESVSRNLAQLEQAGIIQLHRGKIHILDFGELQRIADPDRL
jgi:CRP-like cAMP-binding protein